MAADLNDLDETLFYKDNNVEIRVYYPCYPGYYLNTHIINPNYNACCIDLVYELESKSKVFMTLGVYNIIGGLKDFNKSFTHCDDLFIYGFNIYLQNKCKLKSVCKKLCSDGMIQRIIR